MDKHEKRERGRFSGPVLDGHFAGDWISSEVPQIELHYVEKVWDGVSSYSRSLPSMGVTIQPRAVVYTYLRSYGAWAKMWEG